MNFYEGMFIVDANLSNEEIEKAVKEVETFITSKKGVIKEKEEIGKRKLEYKIGKNEEGFYLLLHFTLPAKEVAALNRKCKLNQSMLRNMIIEADPKTVTKFASVGKE